MFDGFWLLRSKIFGGFRGCRLLDFRGRLAKMVVVVVGRFPGGGLWWVVAVRLRFSGGLDLVVVEIL